jgi:hypothetical protein
MNYKVIGNEVSGEEYHFFAIGSIVEQIEDFSETVSGEHVGTFVGIDKVDGERITQILYKGDVEIV